MRKRKKDGRSSPRLKPCPPEEQRYVLRHCTKHGLPLIDVGNGELPNPEKLRKEIEACLNASLTVNHNHISQTCVSPIFESNLRSRCQK